MEEGEAGPTRNRGRRGRAAGLERSRKVAQLAVRVRASEPAVPVDGDRGSLVACGVTVKVKPSVQEVVLGWHGVFLIFFRKSYGTLS